MPEHSGMKAKVAERLEARRLRRNRGMPLREIAERLGVSLNSVHRWTLDIELSPEQHERNRRGPTGPWNPKVVAARAAAWRSSTASGA
jgi:transcriptional regulator with XRE-family HTH domain